MLKFHELITNEIGDQNHPMMAFYKVAKSNRNLPMALDYPKIILAAAQTVEDGSMYVQRGSQFEMDWSRLEFTTTTLVLPLEETPGSLCHCSTHATSYMKALINDQRCLIHIKLLNDLNSHMCHFS